VCISSKVRSPKKKSRHKQIMSQTPPPPLPSTQNQLHRTSSSTLFGSRNNVVQTPPLHPTPTLVFSPTTTTNRSQSRSRILKQYSTASSRALENSPAGIFALTSSKFVTGGGGDNKNNISTSGVSPNISSSVISQQNIIQISTNSGISSNNAHVNPIKMLALSSANSAALPPIRVDFGGPLQCQIDARSPAHFSSGGSASAILGGATTPSAMKKDLQRMMEDREKKEKELQEKNWKEKKEREKKIKELSQSGNVSISFVAPSSSSSPSGEQRQQQATTITAEHSTSPEAKRRQSTFSGGESSFAASTRRKSIMSASSFSRRKSLSPSSRDQQQNHQEEEEQTWNSQEQKEAMEEDDRKWEEKRNLINARLYTDFGPQAPIFKKLFLADDLKTRQKEIETTKAKRRRENVLEGRVPPPEDQPPIPVGVAMEVGLKEIIEIEKEQWMRFSVEEGENGKPHGLGPSQARSRYIEAIRFMKEHERVEAEKARQKAEDEEKKRMMRALRESGDAMGMTQVARRLSHQNNNSNNTHADEFDGFSDDDDEVSSIFEDDNHDVDQPTTKTSKPRSGSLHATFLEETEDATHNNLNNNRLRTQDTQDFFEGSGMVMMNVPESGEEDPSLATFGELPHFGSFLKKSQSQKDEAALKQIMGSDFVFRDDEAEENDENPSTKKKQNNNNNTSITIAQQQQSPLADTFNPSGSFRVRSKQLSATLRKKENREIFGEFAEEIMAMEDADEQNRVDDDEDGKPQLARLPPTYTSLVNNLLKTVHLSRPEIQQRGLARTMQQRGCEENNKRRRKNEVEMGEHHHRMMNSAAARNQKFLHPNTQKAREMHSILEEALEDVNRISANAYAEEVTDKAIFFRHVLLSEKHSNAQHSLFGAGLASNDSKSNQSRAGVALNAVNSAMKEQQQQEQQQRTPMIMSAHAVRRKKGALTSLFGEKNPSLPASSSSENTRTAVANTTSKDANSGILAPGSIMMIANNNDRQNAKNKKFMKPSELVMLGYFNESKLKRRNVIPGGSILEIGGKQFLYDETMRM
jgi:hypothetical protein